MIKAKRRKNKKEGQPFCHTDTMSIYDTLNDAQKKAVFTTEGPLLLLAGAGSGKTRVITHRIAYLMEHCQVAPWKILAITFTNKAANEMRERIDSLIGFGSERIWVSTFHRLCVFILRKNIHLLGYDSNFIIYDSDDQKSLMREVLKYLNIDSKQIKERSVLSTISHAKDSLISPAKFLSEAGNDFYKEKVGNAYAEYQKRLKKNNAVDFDDLLCLTVQLFRENPGVLKEYQERFRYIMVDEYQDTNTVQFELVRLLASHEEAGTTVHNLCVVGDDDQSIYKFRGANIYNILNFEKEYPDATVIKLEQNYRSTGNILNAANGVIKNNEERKEKALWTNAEDGELIHFTEFMNEYEEAQSIADSIWKAHQNGASYSDHAILYRTNAQSRVLEERLVNKGIPYKVYGAINFYQRKEIKDLLAYLRTLDNGADDLSVKRIINVPKRGIGLTSIDKIQTYADGNQLSFYEALLCAEMIPGLSRAVSKISPFVSMIEVLRQRLAGSAPLLEIFDELLEAIDFKADIENNSEDEIKAQERLENVDEFRNRLVTFCEEQENASLADFLEDIALVADIDSMDETADTVTLMTLHSAKGLEFTSVYLCGMEDGLFPSYMSIQSEDETAIEEERRLCYVGITRAKKQLHLSCAKMRMQHGETRYNKASRFVHEIPRHLLQMETPGSMQRKPYFQEKNSEERVLFDKSSQNQTFSSPVKGKSLEDLFGNHPLIQKGFPSEKKTTPPGSRPAAAPVSPAKPFAPLSYAEGDTVSHVKFGTGTVVKIETGKKDFEVTVSFTSAGTKKMLAGFANLKKQ